MILTENIIVLKKSFPDVWEKLKSFEEKINASNIEVVMSKSGLPTIKISNGQEIYLHSKYDPGNEAERFVSQFKEEDLKKYQHIFFYGFGLGYHVGEFMKRFPQKYFSLYEPDPDIFFQALSARSLHELPLKQLKNLYIEFQPADLEAHLSHFVNSINKETMFVVLPCYERIFSSHYQRFNNIFVQTIQNKKSGININLAYEKLWVLNSIINFPEVAKTPNILHDIEKNHFRGKPALLVAAGPSLEEELPNVKFIKENGLAYIFAVGSAVKALVGNNIYPDAVCAYDPTRLTQFTYQELMESNITTIPFIFGSSVGFETIKNYPGPKIHMIIDQDTVAPFYLRPDNAVLNKVSDAPSIAVVTLELLVKLGCNPIVLVGQNLAFKNDQWYAKGIHEDKSEQLTKRVKQASLEVEDVYGGKVFTEDGFNRMRGQMEHYIKIFSQCRVINTTKGGAKIHGADFIPLETLVKDCFTKRVVTNWYTGKESSHYSEEYKLKQAKIMEKACADCVKILDAAAQIIIDIDKELSKNNVNAMDKLFLKFDKQFKKLIQNLFFQVFLRPMNRVRFEVLLNQVPEMRFETDIREKAKKVSHSFGAFIHDCRKDVQLIYPPFQAIQKALLNPEEMS